MRDAGEEQGIDAVKRGYYSRADVVERYEEFRFAGPGGRYENDTELKLVAALLRQARPDPAGTMLDCPCGTGRLTFVAAGHAARLVTADASLPMLRKCGRQSPENCRGLAAQTTFFRLPFRAGVFSGIISIRFLFHTNRLTEFMAEGARCLRPGGIMIFDTIDWSPRFIMPHGRALGGRMFRHGPAAVRAAAGRAGLQFMAEARCFLMPSFFYKYLPGPALAVLRRLEALPLLRPLLTKRFWCFVKQ